MDFDYLGRAVAFVVGWLAVALIACGAQWLTWHAYKEAKGWPRVCRALRLLSRQEADEAAAQVDPENIMPPA